MKAANDERIPNPFAASEESTERDTWRRRRRERNEGPCREAFPGTIEQKKVHALSIAATGNAKRTLLESATHMASAWLKSRPDLKLPKRSLMLLRSTHTSGESTKSPMVSVTALMRSPRWCRNDGSLEEREIHEISFGSAQSVSQESERWRKCDI